MNSKIDFVILWVDGNDFEWQNEKRNYDKEKKYVVDDEINRYRDWDNLKYWFRGVDKFAPWVNNIFFITYGHLPHFLNLDNPKLKVVKHEDFINPEYLPLFNSNAIEMNLNNIKELSEKFVLFNDDMFIIDFVNENDFFKNDLPCDEYSEDVIIPTGKEDIFHYTMFNNLKIINERYSKKDVYRKNKSKYFNIIYGKNNIKTLLLKCWKNYTGFGNPHIPQSFLKSYFEKLWREENEEVVNTIKNRFRSKEDITQYLIRYLQLLDGNFVPRESKFGQYFGITNNNQRLINHIVKQKSKLICLNDYDRNIDFEKSKCEIINAFEKILPEKSTFEK